MTKEQEESLKKLRRQIIAEKYTKNIGIPVYISDLKNVLSMLEEKYKTIDLMSEAINNNDIDEDICRRMGQKEDCNEFEDKEKCKECIKQYFENKAKEVE